MNRKKAGPLKLIKNQYSLCIAHNVLFLKLIINLLLSSRHLSSWELGTAIGNVGNSEKSDNTHVSEKSLSFFKSSLFTNDTDKVNNNKIKHSATFIIQDLNINAWS